MTQWLPCEHILPLHARGVVVHETMRHARDQINSMIEQAEGLAAQQQPALIAQALEKMHTEQQSELQRMQALAAINPNIRDEEIQFLTASTASMQRLLEGAQIRLDAVRVALVTE